ncbi:hypothetical protein GGP41_009231 [Bipolaris sorokiniana]|uniref:Kri1-like C-terminal domain-containing protein n=1 Tax=Cochliobolus sativus TaxID=45130 RepID=A0A8H6DVJ5_COCSA|nr:hypothetical protein GGP41_009231 [Bipolaris sorokiniana]
MGSLGMRPWVVTAAANVRVHALAPAPPKFCDQASHSTNTDINLEPHHMAATKDKTTTGRAKRELNSAIEPPAKKAKLLDNTDDEGSDSDDGQASLKINEDYARRFEHNKKRAEQFRLEEKYGKDKAFANGDGDESEDSEEGVEEDDAADLLDEDLDEQVNATLQALRAKDPRIYNKEVKFYRDPEEGDNGAEDKKKEKPMTLRDYHTKNLLEGKFAIEEEEDAPPKTYAQEQEEARQDLVKALDAAGDGEDDDDFIVAKEKPEKPKDDRPKITAEDVEKADQDPETFLSNFMASRAWVPTKSARFQPLESDDEDEDAAADEWENSYNLYFEDTTGANEKIMTYARDAVASTTVRRDEKSGRRKAREAARAKREAEKREKEQELARLRKLKVEEMENKVKQIRKIGGLSGRDFNIDEWKDVLEADWSDEQWDAEMQKRFGDAYYGEEEEDKKSKKPKKPNLEYEAALATKPSKAASRFRYRETSPTSFGLTARDILLADDKALNEFAGLKKLATFRDPVKKKKDKKFLSKKARIRQWRKDTFGDAEGPKGGFESLVGEETAIPTGDGPAKEKKKEKSEGNIVEGEKKKKKRSRKRKLAPVEL